MSFNKRSGLITVVLLLLVMCIAGGCNSSSSNTSSGTSNLKTYIASNLTSDLGRELSSRFTNVVSSYGASDDIVNYVVSAADLAANEELREQAVDHLIQNKNVIIVEPTLENLKAFYTEIYEFLEEFEAQEAETIAKNGYSETELPDDVNAFLNEFRLAKSEASLDTLLSFFGEDEDAVPDIVCFRGDECYIANPGGDEEGTTEVIKPDIPEASLDESEGASEDASETVTVEEKSPEVLFADGCIEWINEYKEYTPEQENSKTASIQSTEANGTPTLTVDNAKSLTVDSTFYVSREDGGCKNIGRVKMNVLAWACHSFESSCDYVIFKNQITCHNEDLQCPDGTDETDWYDRYGLEDMYGPYFKSLESCTMELFANTAGARNFPTSKDVLHRLGKYDAEQMSGSTPAASQGSTSYSDGFSYTIGGNVGVAVSGPSVGLTGSFSVSEGSSRPVQDISTERADTDDYFKWVFLGKQIKWQWRPLWFTNKHEIAPSILRNQLDMTINGGWQISDTRHRHSWGNQDAQYTLRFSGIVGNEILFKKGHRIHSTQHTNLHMLPCHAVCRYKNTLSTSMKCSGYNPTTGAIDLDKQRALEDYLKSKIPAYKDQYPVAVLENPNDSSSKGVFYLQQHGSSILKDIKTQMTNMKQALRDAGYGDAGVCKISITASDVPSSCPNPLCYIEVDLGSEEERKNE